MKKILKCLAFLAFTSVLFLLVVSLAFYHLVRVGEFRRYMVSEIEQQTALKIQLGEAHLEFGRILGVSFHNVALSEPDEARPAITAEQVTARVAFLPLFQRKLIFDEIRLQKPVVQLFRDPDGRVPLLDKLLNLPFFKRQDAEFNMDLRAVRISDGQIDLVTARANGGETALHLRDTDADITRISGEPLRKFLTGLIQSQRSAPQGPALEFRLRSAVERDGDKTSLRAQGKMIFAANVVEFGKAWWDAELEFVDVPGKFLQQFSGADLGITSLSGHLAQRLRVVGNMAQGIQLGANLEFRQLAVEAPNLFARPLTLGDGRAEFALRWSPERLELERLYFRSQQIQFALQGDVRELGGNDPQLHLNLSALTMPLARLRDFLPSKLLGSPELERWAAFFQDGELQLTRAGIKGRWSQIRHMNQSGLNEGVWLEGQVRNAAVKMSGESVLPLSSLDGRLKFEKGVLTLRNVKGQYGQSRITNLSGTLTGLFQASAVDLHGRGELDLAEVQQQLKSDWLPARINQLASSAQQVGGKGKVDIVVRRSGNGPFELNGWLTVDNGRLRLGEFALSEIKGDVSVSTKEIKAQKVRALLSGAPVQIQLTLRDYGAENGTFDLVVDSPGVRAGIMAQLLLSTGSSDDPGVVRGSVRYQGALNSVEGRRFTGKLDLANAQLSIQPLLQPLRDLTGRVEIDEQGIDFQSLRGLTAGVTGTFNGRWRYGQKPQLLFDFASPSLDVTHLLTQVDPESTEFYANLQAVGKLRVSKGRFGGFEFSDFKSDVAIDRRVWRFTNATMQSADGTVEGTATLTDRPDLFAFAVTPKIQRVPMQTFLKWFDLSTTEMTGKVNIAGSVQSSGKDAAERKRNLQGAFNLRIEDGTLHRLRIVVQILNLLDLSRWFTLNMPDLTKQGIRFRKITGDFKVTNGVYSTHNLIVDSDDLRMTGEGKVDVPKDEIDFLVAVRPFAGIDTAISYIPLVGWSIAAIKNSFLVASFNIRGPINEPIITPAPLGTLSEVVLGVLGIPKNIINLIGGEKKDEPATEQPKEARGEKTSAANP